MPVAGYQVPARILFHIDLRTYLCAGQITMCMQQIEMLKSKIHRVRVTDANLEYVGSITIDEDLMDAANIIEFEKVQVVNNNNGERLETYVIKGERGTGIICLNGAAARKVQKGDILIIVSYIQIDRDAARSFKPVIIFPDENNRIPR